MTSSTVENLVDIAAAAPAGIQATDLFYVFRPGTPDADFRADGDDLQTAVLGGVVAVSAFARTLLDDAAAATARATLGLAASSTDNTLVRFDGASGQTQSSGIAVSDANEISGFLAQLVADAGTSRSLASTDTGTTIRFSSNSAVTVTLPNSLPVGFTCEIIQGGTGQVSFSPAAGAAINHRLSHTKIAGQYGAARLLVTTNGGGSAATYNLAGDTSI